MSLPLLLALIFIINNLVFGYDHQLVEPTTEHLDRDHLKIHLNAFDQNFTLDLIKNQNFISETFKLQPPVFLDNVKEITSNCHYKGIVAGQPTSFAAISFCDKILNGMFEVDGRSYHILSDDHGTGKTKIFTKTNDVDEESIFRCGFEPDLFPEKNREKRGVVPVKDESLFHRPRFVEMVLVNDFKLFQRYNRNLHFIYKRNVQIANIVNALYSQFNISVVLSGVVVWEDRDQISISNNSSETLDNFLKYRRDKLINQISNDNAQLITASSFENGIVGKALKQTMCTFEYSGGVNYDYHETISLIATTIAHEMGHNFGMEHDHEGCHCPANNCIMGPSSSFPHPRHWSSCSTKQLTDSLKHGLDYCLWNEPRLVFQPSCGNGLIDDGEECDCGLPEFCTNKCCDPATCKLANQAECANGQCCDRSTCKIVGKNSQRVCRPAISICDKVEMCDGVTENCPRDRFVPDGTECSEGYAYCYRGKCETRESRCKLLWGKEASVASYRCYQNNAHGNSSGNCGFNKSTKQYIKCQTKDDVICGRLHCSNHNRKLTLNYGPEGSTVISQLFESYRESTTCFSAIVDLGPDEDDVGLVPNGAKCGLNSMCINQRCIQIETSIQCDIIRDPDSCDSGGSSSGLLTFIYIFFFLILPAVSLAVFLFYYCSNRIPEKFRFRQKAFVTGPYHNNRRGKTNGAGYKTTTVTPTISGPLETELSAMKPTRPAPPPPIIARMAPPPPTPNRVAPPPPTLNQPEQFHNPSVAAKISQFENKNQQLQRTLPTQKPKPTTSTRTNSIARPKRSPPKPPDTTSRPTAQPLLTKDH